MTDQLSSQPELATPASRHRFARLGRLPRLGCLVLAFPCAAVAVFLAFLTVISPPAYAAIEPQPFPADFMKGISYQSRQSGDFASADAELTLRDVVLPTGANWVAVIVTCFQETIESTTIDCTNPVNATDDDIRAAIRNAHALGLKVMLKPHVDPRHQPDSRTGRFSINFGSDEAAWAEWFASYTRFITHYAALAEETGADYFSIGCELEGTVQRADEWRAIIHQIRAIYGGPLTYAALTYFEPVQVSWWDELDAIGIDAYYALTLTKSPTTAQMSLGWTPNVAYLSVMAATWNKPIIITEVGYMSVDGTNILPGDWSLQGAVDLQEQADAYQALFNSLQGQPWWHGVFWWAVNTDPNQGGAQDHGYSFHNKPAETVLRRYFGGVS